jgi:hypothetical protein
VEQQAHTLAAGCTNLIDAHGEGVALFDPLNLEQS